MSWVIGFLALTGTLVFIYIFVWLLYELNLLLTRFVSFIKDLNEMTRTFAMSKKLIDYNKKTIEALAQRFENEKGHTFNLRHGLAKRITALESPFLPKETNKRSKK